MKKGEIMQTIVLSGINLFEGGPLSIYYDLLNVMCTLGYDKKYHIIAFVHKLSLFRDNTYRNIEFIELPKSRKNYFFRLYYEFFFFYIWSKSRNINYWISLHDITPNVFAERRYVYCHNPSIFYKPSKLDYKFAKKNVLFCYFYKYLYRINIKKNNAVIVQQCWIKREFEKIYHLDNVIVSRPLINTSFLPYRENKRKNKEYTFLFPAFPRVFKNFEIICKACDILNKKGIEYKVILTVKGNESPYTKYLYKEYSKIKNIEWVGLLKRETLLELYSIVDCLIFPSKLETWGLPISEFKGTKKRMLLSDLPYAHESIGNYDNVSFFNPDNPDELAKLMDSCIKNEPMHGNIYKEKNILKGWEETLEYLIGKIERNSK